MEYNEIEPRFEVPYEMIGAATKKFRELRRKLRAHIGHGLKRKFYSRRSNPPLFLSSSAVERSAVN